MVGSIAFSKKEGDHVKKGDEVLDVLIYYCSIEVWYLGFLILLSFPLDSLDTSHSVEAQLFAFLRRLVKNACFKCIYRIGVCFFISFYLKEPILTFPRHKVLTLSVSVVIAPLVFYPF